MKLSLKELIKEFGGLAAHGGPGRPQGPNASNQHHFGKHPRSAKNGGYYNWGTSKYPYVGDKDDLESGFEAADSSADGNVEELPEMKLSELFKFTQSANDNTSFHRPPTMGSGAPRAYGKSAEAFGTFDPSEEDNEKRLQSFEGREDTKAKKIGEAVDINDNKNGYYCQECWGSGVAENGKEECSACWGQGWIPSESQLIKYTSKKIGEAVGSRQRHTDRSPLDMVTRDPWKSGMPGHGPKKDIEGMEAIDDLLSSDEEISFDKTYKKLIKNEDFRNGADTSWSRMALQKIVRGPKADFNFWNDVEKSNNYLMNTEYDIKKRNKEVARAKKTKKQPKTKI